jgi:hypothetical protein
MVRKISIGPEKLTEKKEEEKVMDLQRSVPVKEGP